MPLRKADNGVPVAVLLTTVVCAIALAAEIICGVKASAKTVLLHIRLHSDVLLRFIATPLAVYLSFARHPRYEIFTTLNAIRHERHCPVRAAKQRSKMDINPLLLSFFDH